MAGSRTQSNTNWRQESSLQESTSAAAPSKTSLPRAGSSSTSRRITSPAYKRSLSPHSREEARHHKFQRRRSRSRTTISSRRGRDRGELYTRRKGRSPSPSRQRNNTSKSIEDRPSRDQRSRSRNRSSSARRGRDTARSHPQDWETERRRRESPLRPTGDSYIPPEHRRPRLPPASTYRPNENSDRRRSNSPPRNQGLGRNFASGKRRPRRRNSPSPPHKHRSHRSPQPPLRTKAPNTYNSTGARPRQSPSPRHHRSPERQAAERARRHSRDLFERDDRRKSDSNMRPTYYHGGRGGSRPPNGLHNYSGSPQHYIAPPQPAHYQQPMPYGPGRGGYQAHSPYHGSHGGSPYAPPYRQDSYPPPPHRQDSYPPTLQQASPGYYAPQPPQYYNGGSPSYPPQPFPPHTETQRSTSGQQSPLSASQLPRETNTTAAKKRGHFSNLSWTPTQGSRGGVQPPTQPKAALTSQSERKKPRFDKRKEYDYFDRLDRRDRDERAVKMEEEEEDDPFRPSKHLRAEDETIKANEGPRPPPSKAQIEADNKFKFAFKSKSSHSTNPVSAFEKKHIGRREKRLVKRLKQPPIIPPEYAESESVYYRKPGNESVVGSGTYGKVFRAVHVYTGEKVALKKIRMEGERDGFPVTAIREVKLLQSLNHDNIVRLQEVMVEKNDCYMVFEYLSHDLTGLLNHPNFKLENYHKKHLAQQLFDGLDYLHRRGVLHRDIKAANILISNTGQLKLADFGLARFFAKRRQLDYTNRVITIWYRSPELLLGETQYGPAVDIWSASCVLVEIFTKHAIFPGDGGEINQLDKIYNVLGTPTRTDWPGIVDMAWFELLRPSERKTSTFEEKYRERVTPAAFDLLTWMFRYDPTKRPSAQQVLEHAYFRTEEPEAKRVFELKELEGDWHEFESKALRKEKERVEREARKEREREARHREREREMESREKRKMAEGDGGSGVVDAKRVKVEDGVSIDKSAGPAFR